MIKIFAVITEKNREITDFNFITITGNDIDDPENMGASAKSIMKVKHMGYNSVSEYWDSWLEFNDWDPEEDDTELSEIETQINNEYTGNIDYPGYDTSIKREFREYIN